MRFAREHGLLTSVKAGGHNIAGQAICEDGFVIDLSQMRGVFVDAAARTARVQAGCTLGDVDRETQLHGLAAVMGFVSTTGAAGVTVGGGFGYLTRQRGWTCDNLRSVEVVTADGELRVASDREYSDLFWALRGGGGNFGVVTSFEYELHPVGPAGCRAPPDAGSVAVADRMCLANENGSGAQRWNIDSSRPSTTARSARTSRYCASAPGTG